MNTGKISVRYAKALLDTALDEKIANEVNTDIKQIFAICENPDFKQVIENPVIVSSKKIEILNGIFYNRIEKLTYRFLLLLIKNKREIYLKAVCRSFLTLYRKHFRINSVNIISATDIDTKIKNELIEIVEKTFSKKVELSETVDSTILGGFILNIEDLQFDASIASKLKKIQRELIETTAK